MGKNISITLTAKSSYKVYEFSIIKHVHLKLILHLCFFRSVVIHKRERNFQWTCGTIQPDYKQDGIREVIGMASFHRKGSFVEGYIRFVSISLTSVINRVKSYVILVNRELPDFIFGNVVH